MLSGLQVNVVKIKRCSCELSMDSSNDPVQSVSGDPQLNEIKLTQESVTL